MPNNSPECQAPMQRGMATRALASENAHIPWQFADKELLNRIILVLSMFCPYLSFIAQPLCHNVPFFKYTKWFQVILLSKWLRVHRARPHMFDPFWEVNGPEATAHWRALCDTGHNLPALQDATSDNLGHVPKHQETLLLLSILCFLKARSERISRKPIYFPFRVSILLLCKKRCVQFQVWPCQAHPWMNKLIAIQRNLQVPWKPSLVAKWVQWVPAVPWLLPCATYICTSDEATMFSAETLRVC